MIVEIFAVIFLCNIDCITIHDRAMGYKTLKECKFDITSLKKIYKTNLIYCVQGDILKDEYLSPRGA